MVREKYFKNQHVEMWLEDGIIFVIYMPHATIDLEIAREIVAERLKIADGVTYPTFSDITKGFTANKAARDCFAKGDAVKFVSCGAIIVESQMQKLLGTVFLRINKPVIPAKLFTNREKAIAWLQQYKQGTNILKNSVVKIF